MKKILILVTGLFLGIAFMAYYYFSKLGTENDAKDLALQSATNNAALVFSFNNDKSFYGIIASQGLLQQVIGKEKTMLLKQIKERLINDNSINRYIQDQPIYISVLPDTNRTLNYLVTVQIQPDLDIAKFSQKLKESKKITAVEKDLFTIEINDSLHAFIGIQNQVLTLSTSKKLVKEAHVRLADNPFTAYIKESSRHTKNILLALYVNFNQSPALLKNIIAGNINGEISLFNQQNSFAAFSYNFSKEKILFNGSTEIKDQESYLKLFENIPAQQTSIQNILPDNTANYTLYAFEEYVRWNKKLAAWQVQHKESEKIQSVIQSIKNEYRINLNSIFNIYTKNQFVVFQLNTREKLAAIALKNGEKVKQLLLDVSADYNDDIKIFKSADILSSYFGEPFKKFRRPYYTIIDNNLVVANNASTVQVFLNDYRNNRLLIGLPEYLDAMNQVANTSNITYYINTKNSADIFRNNVLLPYYKHLRADSGLRSFDTFCYQMSADKSKFITNLLLNKYIKEEIPDSLSNR